ncbi:permease-like cell division protein FtsX [bacterium]|nr:permease-like cell division protein FtsX [bacterium]
MVWVGVLTGFLIFLLNILLGISFYSNAFNAEIQGKLGMYFYIVDDASRQSEIDKQVMDLRDKLKNAGLSVQYSSKEDALDFLKKSLQELSGNLERFGVENPLPATLYVTFHDQSQYEILQQTIDRYQGIILNYQES